MLCEGTSYREQLFAALWGLWFCAMSSADLRRAHELSLEIGQLDLGWADPGVELEAYHAIWTTHLLVGEPAEALEFARRGVELYRRDEHHSLTYQYGGQDPGVCARASGGVSAWLLGYPDRARRMVAEGLELARTTVSEDTRANALWGALHLARMVRGDIEELDRLTTEMVQFREARTLRLLGVIFQGWAMARRGSRAEGIRVLETAISDRGVSSGIGFIAHLRAEALADDGQPETALEWVVKALDAVNETGETWWQAELHRLEGELLRLGAAPDEDRVAGRFLRALEVAEAQRARSLELRAATSMARLRRDQGRSEEARAVLAPIYDWFTEGFDTPDLYEAKAVLDELA